MSRKSNIVLGLAVGASALAVSPLLYKKFSGIKTVDKCKREIDSAKSILEEVRTDLNDVCNDIKRSEEEEEQRFCQRPCRDVSEDKNDKAADKLVIDYARQCTPSLECGTDCEYTPYDLPNFIKEHSKVLPWLTEIRYGAISCGSPEEIKHEHELEGIPNYVAAAIDKLCEREHREIDSNVGNCSYDGGEYKCKVHYIKLDDGSLRVVVDWYELGECGIAYTTCPEQSVADWCKNGFESQYYGTVGENIRLCKEEINGYDWDLLGRLGYHKVY